MKVLIIQLARFGDNFQTWPVVKSFKRNNPEAELHYLCRSTFKEAITSLDEIDRVWEFDSAKYIHHLESCSDENITRVVESDIKKLSEQKFDQIINLTFSPLSSYITNSLEREDTNTIGYTRHEDGFLNIPDDASALIFGQMGVDKFNRIHLTRLLSAIVGVDLLEQDWSVPKSIMAKGALRFTELPDKYMAVHIGGSTNNKLLSSGQWINLLNSLQETNKDLNFVLLGSNTEKTFADTIITNNPEKVLNLVGATQIEDLFHIIDNSKCLLAPDSSLVHMSSLLNKKCINLSFASVNFWETGPLATNSYVFWHQTPQHIDISQLAIGIDQAINNKDVQINHAKVKKNSSLEAYELVGYAERNFEWDIIKAIYLGHEFPILDDINIYNALKQMAELADMAIRDLEMVRSGQFQNMNLEIIANVETLLGTLEKLVPEVRPIIWWFNTEKVRIGPWSDQQVFDRNFDIYNQLRSLLAIYVGTSYIHPQVAE